MTKTQIEKKQNPYMGDRYYWSVMDESGKEIDRCATLALVEDELLKKTTKISTRRKIKGELIMISKRIKNVSFGDTLYYIGNACDEGNCPEYNVRCDIGCEKLNTKVVKSFTVNQMRTNINGETVIGYSDTLSGYGLEEMFFDLKDKHKKFFFSREEAEKYL